MGSNSFTNMYGGANDVQLTSPQMPPHTHTYNGYAGNSGSGVLIPGTGNVNNDYVSNPGTNSLENTGGNDAHENRPPFLKLHFIIKVQ